MAGKQISGEGLAANLAGMSKTQLYDIMSQMKSLIEQNQHQARQILIQNPLLTRALFQAQIMLGMVKPPQPVPLPSTQPQAPQQPSQPVQQTNANVVHSTPSQVGLQENVTQAPIPVRKQPQSQPPMAMSSAPMQGFHSQPVPSQPVEQPRGHMNPQATQLPHQQASQVSNMPSLPLHSGSQPPSVHQPPMPPLPGHLQQPMQTGGVTHHTLQPPLPPQPRPPIHAQYQPPMGSNMNFPNAGISQMPHSQPMFHPSSRPGGMGPSFHQGQPPLPNQPPHQPLYQMGGSHLGTDFNNQGGNTAQMERGSPWPPVSRENTGGPQLSGPLPLGPGQGQQMPLGNQPPRPPPLAPEVEQALLQQVMSLTQEQINLLPSEQRQQVLQLQQMLRQ